MRKTVFAVLMAAVALAGSPETMTIEKNVPVKIRYLAGKPFVLAFNFVIAKTGKLMRSGDGVSVHTMPKSIIVIPDQQGAEGILTIVNEKGNSYIVQFEPGGDKSAFVFEDPVYEFNYKPTLKVRNVSTVVERECNILVKKVVLGKKMKGYTMLTAPLTVQIPEIDTAKTALVLERKRRYSGKKYIVEYWEGKNVSDSPKYIEPEDFYTKGIIAISPSQRRVDVGESFNMVFVVNKATLKDMIEGGGDE
ncbi:MAG: hypothetical protein B6D63_02830 [Candidatus Latescibacteria bacterium 4484_7]|nr:MAG: hypothetical protein B6D63_02830 [Candidatus Latescibacteria bacterium 4484_7]